MRMRRDARAWAESRQLHHGEGNLCDPSLWKESGLASPLDMHSCARACVKAAGKAAARVRTSRDCFSALSEVSVQQLAAAFEMHEALLDKLFASRPRHISLDLFGAAHAAGLETVPAEWLAATIEEQF